MRPFDHAVVATHADEALSLLSDADADERRLLGAFPYSSNRTILHSDTALMPRRKQVWSSWNFLANNSFAVDAAPCVTYWMNRLQSIDPRVPLFVTLNPVREPNPNLVHKEFDYTHPLFDQGALQAQRHLWRLQGRRNTWFCGSYFGYGFHEDALQAGLSVAEQIGGVRRPWVVAGESGRIVLGSPMMAVAE